MSDLAVDGVTPEQPAAQPASAAPVAPARSARSAQWWAAIALACSLAALAAGAVANIDLREALRTAAIGLTVVAAIEDIRTRRIRNVLTAPALVLALAGAPVLTSALLAMLLAPLPFLVLAIVQPAAMGMGDVKLAAVAGALVGLAGVFPWLIGTTFIGGLLAVVALIRGGRRGGTFAYGPALVVSLLWLTFAPLLGA